MKKPNKFQVGDTAWLPGDWRGHGRNKFSAYRVIERRKTGYVMHPLGITLDTPFLNEKVSTIIANRDYYTTQEKEDWEWQRANRYKISHEIEHDVDTATLRKIADLIGYVPEATP